jgi:NAD(P)H-hydrate epimerase
MHDDTVFETGEGLAVPAVTADQMRDVDRIAVEELGLRLLQMMENAGRALARHVRERAGGETVTVLAGPGGNGGGGMAAARHLANRDVDVRVVLDRDPAALEGAAAIQHRILSGMDVPVAADRDSMAWSAVVVDALVGYGLSGPLRGTAARLVEALPDEATVVSLDVPTGRDATTGETPGPAVRPDLTVTLALPKTGLAGAPGALVLADIGIPAVVYGDLDVDYANPFDDDTVALTAQSRGSDS